MKTNKYISIFILILLQSAITLADLGYNDEPKVGWHDFIDGDIKGRSFYPVIPNPTKADLIKAGYMPILFNPKTGELCTGVVDQPPGKHSVRAGVHAYLGNAYDVDFRNGDWFGGAVLADENGELYVHERSSWTSGQTTPATGDGFLRDPVVRQRMLDAFMKKTGLAIRGCGCAVKNVGRGAVDGLDEAIEGYWGFRLWAILNGFASQILGAEALAAGAAPGVAILGAVGLAGAYMTYISMEGGPGRAPDSMEGVDELLNPGTITDEETIIPHPFWLPNPNQPRPSITW